MITSNTYPRTSGEGLCRTDPPSPPINPSISPCSQDDEGAGSARLVHHDRDQDARELITVIDAREGISIRHLLRDYDHHLRGEVREMFCEAAGLTDPRKDRAAFWREVESRWDPAAPVTPELMRELTREFRLYDLSEFPGLNLN
ncbi:hypothetical protein [Nocardiopsis gilva]|uniref:hypothetical protein n=1 Tax=Nocardiopsis gilva TaxID=280236 RepID=UPI0012FDA31B|nr:hypothetical protein [Nocardiopsis gilva]